MCIHIYSKGVVVLEIETRPIALILWKIHIYRFDLDAISYLSTRKFWYIGMEGHSGVKSKFTWGGKMK